MATATRKPFLPIPYGMADFGAIRREGFLYVDKTRFLRDLEDERHVFLLRPRRFGKSCWVSILQHYYDRARKGEFEALFAGLDIGREPTANRSQYAVLRLNFSAFSKELSTLRKNFEEHCDTWLRAMFRVNADLFPDELVRSILARETIGGRLDELFSRAGEIGVRLYLLIDEYDNFANTILAGEGHAAYHAMTHGSGWFRDFFATLKAGTESGNLERLFITGVSPVTMDDVTSGFNIGTNISFDAAYNQIVGFTEKEVSDLVAMYRGRGVFDQDPEIAMTVMREWYDGYRFGKGAAEDVYNTDMVLYYLKHSIPNKQGPDYLIDTNVRVDYTKLRHLVVVNRAAVADRAATLTAARVPDADAGSDGEPPRRISNHAELRDAKALGLNGNFDVLRQVIAEGQVDSGLHPSFPVDQLGERENFLTLLHCFGLLSVRGVANGRPRLGVPNQTVRQLMYGYLRDAYRDIGVFSVDHLQVRGSDVGDGERRRLAPGGGLLGGCTSPADQRPRLRAGRTAAARLPRRVSGRGQLLRVPYRARALSGGARGACPSQERAGKGLRRHGADAADGSLPDAAPRLRDRAQVSEARRPERGIGAVHSRGGEGAAARLPWQTNAWRMSIQPCSSRGSHWCSAAGRSSAPRKSMPQTRLSPRTVRPFEPRRGCHAQGAHHLCIYRLASVVW